MADFVLKYSRVGMREKKKKKKKHSRLKIIFFLAIRIFNFHSENAHLGTFYTVH